MENYHLLPDVGQEILYWIVQAYGDVARVRSGILQG
jgi:hypothetical protein